MKVVLLLLPLAVVLGWRPHAPPAQIGWHCSPHAPPAQYRRGARIVALAKRASTPVVAESFAELGCSRTLVDSLAVKFGIERPMEAQLLSWQPLRDTQRDLVLIAEAGSGKTLAYLLPLIDKLLASHRKPKRPTVAAEAGTAAPMTATQAKIAKLLESFKVVPRTRQQKIQRGQQEQLLAALQLEEAQRVEQRRLEENLERRLYVVVPNLDLEAQVLRVASDLCAGTPLQVCSGQRPPRC